MKAIYHVLNQFSLRDAQRVLIGECWMPTADLAAIKTAITTGAQVPFSCSPRGINFPFFALTIT